MSILNEPFFHDEQAAYEFIEAHVWPDGPVCPHCGESERVGLMGGKSTRLGTYKCYACRKPFTVKISTIFEASHVPLHKWLQAIFLMCASKKGISANQLHRTLGVTLKTAWFMGHRIREAMRDDEMPRMGGPGSIVEMDETFIGRDKLANVRSGPFSMNKVVTLVDRSGPARSFHVDGVDASTVLDIARTNLAPQTYVMTDDGGHYKRMGQSFKHDAVNHSAKEYGRGEIYTNTVEGYFSIFKRGMRGVYQHCARKHLHRYLAEFDFRYTNRIAQGVDDFERSVRALLGIKGKRLKYATPDPQRA